MEFKLGDEENSTSTQQKQTTYPIDEVGNDGKYYYHAPQPTPVVAPPQKKNVGIPKIVFFIPVIVIIAVVLSIIPWNRKTSLDAIAEAPQDQIESTLGISLTENPEYLTKLSIANGDSSGFRVCTTPQADFGVIYYNQIQYGICFNNPKYSLFGFKIGDPEYKIFNEENTDSHYLTVEEGKGYAYSRYINMIDDMSGGQSTAQYMIGEDGSLLVLVINNNTKRVVNVIYYYDYERVFEGVDVF